MPNEKVIPEALSGAEIKQAVAHKVIESLSKDCYLQDHFTYLKFTGTIKVSIQMYSAGSSPTVEREISVDLGKIPDDVENPDEFLEQYDLEHEIEEAPPNQVRQETEQPIPVLTSKGGRPTVERVKYASKKNQGGK